MAGHHHLMVTQAGAIAQVFSVTTPKEAPPRVLSHGVSGFLRERPGINLESFSVHRHRGGASPGLHPCRGTPTPLGRHPSPPPLAGSTATKSGGTQPSSYAASSTTETVLPELAKRQQAKGTGKLPCKPGLRTKPRPG